MRINSVRIKFNNDQNVKIITEKFNYFAHD